MAFKGCHEIIKCGPLRNECAAYKAKKNCWDFVHAPRACCTETNQEKCKKCPNFTQYIQGRKMEQVKDQIWKQKMEYGKDESSFSFREWFDQNYLYVAIAGGALVVLALVSRLLF